MLINQNGVESKISYPNGERQRTTLTLPSPYAGGLISVTATDFVIDIDPLHLVLEVGQTVTLACDDNWHAVQPSTVKEGE